MAFESKPAASRGFLSGTSFDLLRNRNSVTGSLGSQTSVPPLGSRPLHASSILSESAKGITSNRPLSPNLILKKPQLSATYSISHRIFGAALGTAILITPILMKFSVVYDV
ncbi:succinate dehydrogenase (ubiquinone) cytochrome b560 subunit protein [Dioscorea alata]|uniref:Succinate dehydrogenase (Ubiquinone) cytochrome b560 subunit protein n=2 Tax=Dioscorea alata TaxID=55571 RepID=A0ACB7VN56_DIOAL|nr:succinate dehydrogenase (ubiquinone) cytochrome b560 subunit protein [Dioscorea alata]KAH7675633.1 succinate dehydrogenase (ubiquinone) cytochrome b560 subunit protein [Dioscorea alata]